MSSITIRDKIKSGLKKAIAAVGSDNSDKIFKIDRISTGGCTPIDPPIFDELPILLVDALFQSYNTKQFNETIRAGDKKLVSNSDVAITEGDIIRQGETDFIVIATDTKAPTSDVLVYISQVREK